MRFTSPIGHARSRVWTGSLVAAAILWLATPVAAEELAFLKDEYERYAKQLDDRGLGRQKDVLEKIADLRTPRARQALERIGKRWSGTDFRRTTLILAALVRHAGPDDVDKVIKRVEKGRDPLLLEQLGEILGSTRSPTARHHLLGDALARATPPVKAQIARALGMLRDRDAVTPLLMLTRESDLRVRTEAIHAVGALGDRRATRPLMLFLKAEEPEIRDAAARALGRLRDERALPILIEALRDPDARVAESAALSLGMVDRPEAIDPLINRLATVIDVDLRLADAMVASLQGITGKRFGIDVEMWRTWWDTVKDEPFEKDAMPPGERTVPGPRYYGMRIRSSRAVFVLDVSRSMGWGAEVEGEDGKVERSRLQIAQDELTKVIESVPPTTRFNIVTYSDGVNAWAKSLQKATPGHVKSAVKFVKKQRPQNGTNAYDALQTAFKDKDADTILFLSDGTPTSGPEAHPERILAEVRRWNRYRRLRIHAFLLLQGQAPTGFAAMEDERLAIEFMTKLAGQNDGDVVVVR